MRALDAAPQPLPTAVGYYARLLPGEAHLYQRAPVRRDLAKGLPCHCSIPGCFFSSLADVLSEHAPKAAEAGMLGPLLTAVTSFAKLPI